MFCIEKMKRSKPALISETEGNKDISITSNDILVRAEMI